jgi:hypothetical protein
MLLLHSGFNVFVTFFSAPFRLPRRPFAVTPPPAAGSRPVIKTATELSRSLDLVGLVNQQPFTGSTDGDGQLGCFL